MVSRIGAREARQKFSEVLGRVHYGGETIILESSGKAMAAVIPLEMYEKMIAEREARFDTLDEIRERHANYTEDEIMDDIEAAVEAVRRERAESRT